MGKARKIEDLDVDGYLADSVEIDPHVINEEFIRIPRDFAYWGHRYAQAYKAQMIAKMERDRTQARLRILVRQSIEDSGKKPTESMVDALVEQEDEWQRSRVAEIEAEAERERLRCLLEALRTKRESLVSLGAHIRQEKEHDPVIRAQLAKKRELGE